MSEAFKVCPLCHVVWQNRQDFLNDPAIEVKGYQVNVVEPLNGFFLFNHNVEGCGTTISIEPVYFKDLHEGPMYEDKLNDTVECPGYCLYETNLMPCPKRCECAYVRDILQVIRNWQKDETSGKGS